MANNKEWVSEEKWKIYLRKMYKQSWEREEKWKQIYSHTKNISYCILHSLLPHTQKYCQLFIIMTLYHPLCYRGMCYIVCYSGKNVITFIIFFFLLAVVPHICVCIWWCTFICGRVKGLKCKKNKKNKKRERNSQERKVFVDVIYFRRGGGYGFQVLFYFICWNCELLFILYSALFMKKYKFTKHNFLYPVGDFLFIIYCIKVELLNKWTNSSRHFLLPFHHVVLKLALFYSKDEALESEWNKKHKHSKKKWFYIKYLFIEPSHRMWWKHFKIYINTFIIHCLVRHKNKGQTTTTARKNHGQFSRWSLGSFFKKNYKTLNIFATFLSYFKL